MCESPIIHVHTTVLYMHVQDHVWTRSNDQQIPMSNSSCHDLVPAYIASPAEAHCLVVTAKVEALCHPVPVSSHLNQMSFEFSRHSTLFRPFDISLSPRAAVMPACCTSSRKQAAKVPCQLWHHIIKTVFFNVWTHKLATMGSPVGSIYWATMPHHQNIFFHLFMCVHTHLPR